MKTENFSFHTGRCYGAVPQIIHVTEIHAEEVDDFMTIFTARFCDEVRGISGSVRPIAFGHSQKALEEAIMAEYDAGRYSL